MSEIEIPEFINLIRKDMGFDLVELYQHAQKAISTLKPDQYAEALHVTRTRAQQDYQAGKLDLIKASVIFLSVLDLSYKVEDYDSQIITLCNLGLMYQNAHAYDVAVIFATEAIGIAYDHNLLERKLDALNVLSLVYVNTQETEKRMDVMQEVAETYGALGQSDKKAEIEGQIKQLKEFMALLGK